MIANNGRRKIAVQKNGRLTHDTVSLLRRGGQEFEYQNESLCSPCRNFEPDILALWDDDIPEYVQDGVADLGIVGENIVEEKNATVELCTGLDTDVAGS